jgi:cell wall-associated NlpC family hydrolase
MRKKMRKCFSFLLNRQLGVITRYDSMARTWKRTLAVAIPCLAESGHTAAGWWADGWLWMKTDCQKVLDGGLCFTRLAISGQWHPVAPAIWNKRGFYGALLAFAILVTGALYLEQIPTAFAVRYTGEQAAMASSPQPAGQQSAIRQGAASLIVLTNTACKLQVAENVVNLRSGPDTNEPEIGQARFGDVLLAKAKTSDNWYQVSFRTGTGWIAGWCVQTYRPSSQASAMVADYRLESPGAQGTPEATRGSSDLIGIARRFLGTPYSYGANGPDSFDCSGYVRYVFAHRGISLPRVASDQARAGRRVSTPAPGDLVFFSAGRDGYITHVGIYIGNNSFIQASFQGVTITSLDDPWYKEHYVMAARVE